MPDQPSIERVHVSAFTVPTQSPESDGTLKWDSTTLVLVRVEAGGTTGIGYSYADVSTAHLIEKTLAPKVQGMNALAIGAAWRAMVHAIRKLGRAGICSMAIAAVDNALWDLKGKCLNASVASLLGLVRPESIALLPFMPTPAVGRSRPSTPNTFSITSVSKKWRSKGQSKGKPARCGPISLSRDSDWSGRNRICHSFRSSGAKCPGRECMPYVFVSIFHPASPQAAALLWLWNVCMIVCGFWIWPVLYKEARNRSQSLHGPQLR